MKKEVMVDFAHEGTGPVPKENANARWTSRYHDLKRVVRLNVRALL